MDLLYKISAFIFVCSFVMLIFLFYSFDIKETTITEAKDVFKFKGKVLSVRETNKTLMMNIENCQPISVFFFSDGKNYSELKNKTITATGRKLDNTSYLIDEISKVE